jgi:dipeptidase E
VSDRQIIAAGGALLVETGSLKLERYILNATGKTKLRICFVPTASGEDLSYVSRFFESYSRFGLELEVLRFFRRTPADLRDFLFGFDVVHVGGGNTRSMLAVWRHWGFDAVIREAWERGILMCGSSAGSICWFEEGLTDSVAGELAAMPCLGFVGGSHCPHYDGEKERRPFYQRLVGNGSIRAGYACDDGAALHYVGDRVHAIVAATPTARVYRVEPWENGARETALDTTVL